MRTPNRILEIALSIAIIALASLPFAAEAHSEGFVANKGQVHDQFGRPNQAVRYLYTGPGMNVQLRKNGFSYDTYSVREGERQQGLERARVMDLPVGMDADTAPITGDFHRIDIHFVNGDRQATIVQEGESADYTNYYTDVTGEAGATFVRSYSTVTYRDVWPNIDVRFTSGEDGFKYDVIVHPGGDLNDARFKVEGAAISASLKGRLVLDWGSGSLEELIPESWMEQGRRKERVNAHYHVVGNDQFGFAVDRPINGTLVIDPSPSLTWATYYGGSHEDRFYAVSSDDAGNVYMAGMTMFSFTNIATSGAFESVHTIGSFPAILVKMNGNGVRQWGTYYGSAGMSYLSTLANACSANAAGDVCIGGITTNTAANLSTIGTYQTVATAGTGTVPSGTEGFIAKFNTHGIRQWGTFHGSTSEDAVTDLILSDNGTLAVVGYVSAPGFATTGDVTHAGGKDGYVAMFGTNGDRQWCTYWGGAADDQINGLTYVGTNSIALVGTTSSSTGIATTGAWDQTRSGAQDAFYARMGTNGSITYCTYFGGAGDEWGNDVVYSSLGRVAIVGTTTSSSGIAAGNVGQTVHGGARDGFIASFLTTTGSRQWASYIGGANNDEVYGATSYTGSRILISGYAGSTGLTTAGAWDTQQQGYSDMLIASYQHTGTRDWLSYHGGPDQDRAYDITDVGPFASTDFCVVGSTDSQSGVATNPSHQSTGGGPYNDGVCLRVEFDPASAMSPLIAEGPSSAQALHVVQEGTELRAVLEPSSTQEEAASYMIMDATGRIVLSQRWIAGEGPTPFSIAGLSVGAYTLVVVQGDQRRSARFMVL